MKVDPKMFFQLVREVVRDELKKSLPGIVKEVLAEQYLRRIVSESNRGGSTSTRPSYVDKDDEVPTVVPNDNAGIYDDDTHSIRTKNESVVSKLLTHDNPLQHLYEGVQPITEKPASGVPDAPLPNVDFGRMRQMVRSMERPKGPITTPEQKARELEEKRKALEKPVL